MPSLPSYKDWWYDLKTKSFWPVTLQSAHQASCMGVYRRNDTPGSAVILGGRDGFLRYFVPDQMTDDGTEFKSHIFLGPIPTERSGYLTGSVDTINGQLDSDSANVTMDVHVGDTHEEALASTAVTTHTLVGGDNYNVRPRRKGASFAIRLSNAASSAWAFANLLVTFTSRGRNRKD